MPVGISFWSLRSGTGDVAGLIGVCQDLSSIKQMEQRMRQADRLAAVGRLSANMAHEIRNPLASISGAVEALARDLPPDNTRSQLVEIVLRESARLNQIVGDFLEYARPAPMAAIEINMAEIFDEVLLLIEHRTLPANLKVSREYGDSLPTRADPQRLRQAVWNLCLNAVQAMPDGGELRVGAQSLRDRGGRLQISITDTGAGHRGDRPAAHIRAVLLDQAGGQRNRPGARLSGRRGAWGLDRGAEPRGRGHDLRPHASGPEGAARR